MACFFEFDYIEPFLKKYINEEKQFFSISDNKDLLGYPKDYEVTVRNIKLYNGAGFITIYLGSIITMPGLPKLPNYEKINLVDNEIIGLS